MSDISTRDSQVVFSLCYLKVKLNEIFICLNQNIYDNYASMSRNVPSPFELFLHVTESDYIILHCTIVIITILTIIIDSITWRKGSIIGYLS